MIGHKGSLSKNPDMPSKLMIFSMQNSLKRIYDIENEDKVGGLKIAFNQRVGFLLALSVNAGIAV